jgi:hypothetical protein
VEDAAQMAARLGIPYAIEITAIWGPENTYAYASASYYPYKIHAPAVTVIQGCSTSFIRDLDPNNSRTPGSAKWKPYSMPFQQRLLFNSGRKTKMEAIEPELKKA